VRRRFLPALALAALAVAAAAACGEPGGREGLVDLGDARLDFDRAGWSTDFSRHSVPLEEIYAGGPRRDGIPPVDRPRPVSQREGDRFLGPRDPVIAVTARGRARAYPIRILVWHEIVNDRLGGRPIAVTYCPLCNSSLVFDRRVGGRVRSFGTTGNLRRSNMVMWDRRTQSWWQQLTAEAIVGKLTGERLRPLPAQTLSWRRFKRRYSRGDVLSRATGAERDYERNPYLGYDAPSSPPHLFRGRLDTRLPPKERVVALLDARPPVVVPFSRLARDPAVEVEAGGRPTVVLHERGVASAIDGDAVGTSKDVGAAAAFDRRLGRRELSFARRGDGFVDRQTGSRWDVTGRAVAGRLRGSRLRPVRHDEQFWFALAAFLPQARIAAGWPGDPARARRREEGASRPRRASGGR
jgi:hypothetical protein